MSALSRLCAASALLLSCSLAGCHARAPAGAAEPSPCVAVDDEPRPHLTIALLNINTIGSGPAAVPLNTAARLVFRQVYETLVTIDCTGRVAPGLAESWTANPAGDVWHFRLRTDRTFHDGARITAQDVTRSWAFSQRVPAVSMRHIAAVTALGEHELRVQLHRPAAEPHFFAQPDLAVTGALRRRFPVGSGPFRFDTTAGADTIRLVSARGGATRIIEFRTLRRTDPRTALDSGIDALITSDPAALAYARALSTYQITPLPWSRTLVLLTARAQSDTTPDGVLPLDAIADLARAASQEDTEVSYTRPAEAPFWWQDPSCRAAPGEYVARNNARGIMYVRGEPLARGIAERVAALAWPAERTPAWLRALLPADYARRGAPTVVGQSTSALFATGTPPPLAGVLSLPRVAPGTCARFADDIMAMRFATQGGQRITALLDTREYLVHRAGLGRVLMDGDGMIRFHTGAR